MDWTKVLNDTGVKGLKSEMTARHTFLVSIDYHCDLCNDLHLAYIFRTDEGWFWYDTARNKVSSLVG